MKIQSQCRQVRFPIWIGFAFFANYFQLKALDFPPLPIINQGESTVDFPIVTREDSTVVYTLVEEAPEFPGGVKAMAEFISKNIRFPDSARAKGISGKCFIKFIVDAHGRIKNAEVLKGVENCPECDEEALRVVNRMPRWKPGKQSGKAVNVFYNLPINFRSQ